MSCMREMIEEAHFTFGASFPRYVVPSFEVKAHLACLKESSVFQQGIKELNSLIRNQDLLGVKREQGEIKLRKGIQEYTEDRISAICVSGTYQRLRIFA